MYTFTIEFEDEKGLIFITTHYDNSLELAIEHARKTYGDRAVSVMQSIRVELK